MVNSAAVAILDAHVHIHDCFDVPEFLEHAYENFRRQHEALGSGAGFDGVLLLTESCGANEFERLAGIAAAPGERLGHWRIDENAEPVSLTVRTNTSKRLVLIAGRQIVTGENLEILGLGLREMPEDGLPIREVIDLVQKAGALCVLPWGFGKWTGRRGRIVRELINERPGDNFFVGDNAGRLALGPEPADFRIARKAGIRMLSGTDPLPWTSQADSVGRFGVVIDRGLDPDRPFADLRASLLDERREPQGYGRLESLLPFVRHQVAMQLRKRF